MRENNTLELPMPSSSPHDPAVSPVIGTMLLIALTVIFIAIVVAVVMGISSGMFDFKSVGLTLNPYGVSDENPEHGIGITIYGGADAANIVSLSAVITGPKLIYAPTKANYVENPQIGQEYRFAAYVDPKIIEAIKKKNYHVNLTTDGKNSAIAIDCYVTVTGKFRDGTEQVLLVRQIVIPAIPGAEGGIRGEYVSVIPYYINATYPAHGFIVTILNDSITDLGTVKFSITDPQGKSPLTLTDKKDPAEANKKTYTYDILTKDKGGDGWHLTPYPQVTGNHWLLGKLTGNVTIGLISTPDSGVPSEVTVGPITIPPRFNIFEDKKTVYGNISYENDKISFTSTVNKTRPNSDNLNFAYFFIIDPDNQEELSIKKINGWTDTTNLSTPITAEKLRQLSGKTLEAYVRVKIGETEVWYRVASVPVNSLLTP